MGDPIVLSYGDSIIRNSDLDILNSCQWLNDQIIGFFFEFCQIEKFLGSNFCFVGPEVAQFLKMVSQNEIGIFLEPLGLSSKTAVFLPVNSMTDPSKAGGSHWSLLVFLKTNNLFIHFDSCEGSNRGEAKILANKVGKYLSPELQLNFLELGATQQVNGYDCGIHCIANAQNIAEHLKSGNEIHDLKKVEQTTVSEFRKNLVNLIRSLSSTR